MTDNLEYNTTRERMTIPEYGRNIQKMIQHIKSEEDKDKRTRLAYAVVSIMGQMTPQHKDANDFQQKLWDHLHIIGNFELDVDAPYPMPKPEALYSKPQIVPYASGKIRYSHYGKHIQAIIQKVSEMEEGEDKDILTRIIANHLKKSYLTWNRESVNDDLIIEHLRQLSDDRMKMKDESLFLNTADILARNNVVKKKPQKENKKHGGGKKRSYRSN